MNPQEINLFLNELTADTPLNDRQVHLIRQALKPLDYAEADRLVTAQYRERDRLSPSLLIQNLEEAARRDTHGVAELVHPETCVCRGSGWVDVAPIEAHGRVYDQVDRCRAS